jgi:hypothetical protein
MTSLALIANVLKTFINRNPICSGSRHISPPPSKDLELTDDSREKKWLLPKPKQITIEPASYEFNSRRPERLRLEPNSRVRNLARKYSVTTTVVNLKRHKT